MSPALLVFIISVASAMLSAVNSCSVPRGWKPKSLPERAKSAEIVFYGKVLKSPTRWYHPSPKTAPILGKKSGLYSVEVEIYCIFKGDIVQR